MGIKKKHVPGCSCCPVSAPPTPGPCCDTTPYEHDITFTLSGITSEIVLVRNGSATMDLADLNGTYTVGRATQFGSFVPCYWTVGDPVEAGPYYPVATTVGGSPQTAFAVITINTVDDPSGKKVHVIVDVYHDAGAIISTMYDLEVVTSQDCVSFNFSSACGTGTMTVYYNP